MIDIIGNPIKKTEIKKMKVEMRWKRKWVDSW